MSQHNEEKRRYDRAQIIGENVEVMGNTKGWKEHFIPHIQKLREEAQVIVNDTNSNIETTQFNRGLLKAYDEVLGYVDHTLGRSKKIMRQTVDERLRG